MKSELQVFRKVPHAQNSLFLTFDDGPDAEGTPAVLDLLKRHKSHATFFLVAEKAKARPDLAKRILDEGHTIGNHSLDHRYGVFFANQNAMNQWIASSNTIFRELGIETIGFRPPAGVRTPKLHRSLAEAGIPLIMWEKRFFDTTLRFTERRALKSLATTEPGSIILLHDRQRPLRLLSFLKTLEIYLREAQAKGLHFAPLTNEICKPKIIANSSIGNSN